jgi:hypothetical protein
MPAQLITAAIAKDGTGPPFGKMLRETTQQIRTKDPDEP